MVQCSPIASLVVQSMVELKHEDGGSNVESENVNVNCSLVKEGTKPQVLDMSMEPTVFQNKYQRNNKRGGLKNLRCFPTCGETHKARGFCGRSIIVRIRSSNRVPLDFKKIICIGEFVQAGSLGQFKQGQRVLTTDLFAQKRTADNPVLPFIHGELLESVDSSVSFEFNKRRKGWHYGWSSNKHSCNTEHCFRVHVFQQADSTHSEVIDSVSSPAFVLFCRRRRRFHTEPSAPESAPSAKQRKRNATFLNQMHTSKWNDIQASSFKSKKIKLSNLKSGDEATTTAESLVSLAQVCTARLSVEV